MARGTTSAYPGQGTVLAAPDVPRPDKIRMMQQMAKMDMRMGAPAMKFNPDEERPQQLMENWGMKMDKKKGMAGMGGMHHSAKKSTMGGMEKSESMNMPGTIHADGFDESRRNEPWKVGCPNG